MTEPVRFLIPSPQAEGVAGMLNRTSTPLIIRGEG